MPSLSVCMIVGDELRDNLLAASLRQSARVADEFVVFCSGLDRRSTGTEEFVRRTLAASGIEHTVCYNPWPGFSQQRNLALDHCRGDFTLSVDADEFIDDAFVAEWPHTTMNGLMGALWPTWHLVRAPGETAFQVHMEHGWHPDYHPRLLRNDPRHRYQGDLDEMPALVPGGKYPVMKHYLFHFGHARCDLQGKIDRRNAYERGLVNRPDLRGEHTIAEPLSGCVPWQGKFPIGFDAACLEPREAHDG